MLRRLLLLKFDAFLPPFFYDDMIDEPRSKGFSSCLWCDLRFNIRRSYSPGSENEFVNIESFSDDVTRVENAATNLVVVFDAGGAAPQPSSPQDKASPEFTRDLERTVQREEDPIENLPMVETCKELPEGQDPSPSIAAFNECFGTSYREELLSVSCEMAVAGGGASKLLLLWNSSKFVDETGGEAPTQTLQLPNKAIRDLESSLLLLRRKLLRFLNALSRILWRLLAKKVCVLFFSLGSCSNLSYYFTFFLLL
jgi:hypothetical protein